METSKLYKLLSVYLSDKDTDTAVTAIKAGLPIIIDGAQMPTGKTTLCRELRELGVNAVERFERKKFNDNSAGFVIELCKRIKGYDGGTR